MSTSEVQTAHQVDERPLRVGVLVQTTVLYGVLGVVALLVILPLLFAFRPLPFAFRLD
jgi:hypothetical protein